MIPIKKQGACHCIATIASLQLDTSIESSAGLLLVKQIVVV